jgi:hypothetical protein
MRSATNADQSLLQEKRNAAMTTAKRGGIPLAASFSILEARCSGMRQWKDSRRQNSCGQTMNETNSAVSSSHTFMKFFKADKLVEGIAQAWMSEITVIDGRE